MRQPAEYFDDRDPVLVFIGKKLKESLAVEKLFDEAGVEYGIEVDNYVGGLLFRTTRAGAFFYVDATQRDLARLVLTGAGYRIVDEESQ